MSGVVLEIQKGPDAGRRFRLEVGHYRVVGRTYGAMGGTAMIPAGERRRLDVEAQRVAAEHLKSRPAPSRPGARAEVASFTRDEDIDLSDDAVSQTHAMFFCDEAGISLVDVGSTNGCSVNGQRVSESTLVPGDIVVIGETRLELKPLG